MVPIGESYRPESGFDFRSLLAISILGVITSILCAGGVWAWEISPIPTLLIVTSIVHGMGVALVLSWLINRLKTRNPLALSVIGFACGLLSAVLVHYVHHLVVLNQISKLQRQHLVADPKIPQEEKGKILAEFDANPLAPADEAIAETTGHHGFLGTMIFRNENGITIKRAKVSGWFLWGVWIAEGLIVAILPAMAGWSMASRPFCEECRLWCHEVPQFDLPGQQATPLVEAVRDNLPGTVAALRNDLTPFEGPGTAVLSLHSCPHCDLSYADVSLKVPMKKDQVKQTVLLNHVLVSPEMVAVCRAPAKTVTPPDNGPDTAEKDEATAHEDVEG